MTWTYDGDPSANTRDEVRFLVGDTDTNDQQLSDEEIAYLLAEEGNVAGAAVAAVKGLLAKYARLVDKSVGDLKLSYSQRAGQYAKLLQTLERRRLVRGVGIKAGGTSLARKETVEQDTDRVQPSFKRDQFRYPSTEDQDETIDSDPYCE